MSEVMERRAGKSRLSGWFGAFGQEVARRLTQDVVLRGGRHALAEAEARASLAENRLREALNVLPEGIVFLDNEGRYVMWNAAYADIYARSADLFREGVRLADTLRIGVARGDYPEAVGREEEWLAERLALLDNPGVRHEQRLANGRCILIEERKTQDGGTIGIRIDISELKRQSEQLQKALEAAEAANRAKSDFLANMSHEIRTPLNGVIGLGDVLLRSSLDDDQRGLLSTILASAHDLNNLLSDLLDFSKAEAGKLEIVRTSFDLEALARECVALFAPSAADKALAMRLEVAPDAVGGVIGDPPRIKQILTNLLSNAVKFTAQGAVTLSISRNSENAVVLQVRDTGAGFDQADAARLFARFEQADASTTRQFGGTGLGLSICQQLAELMGGTISASGVRGEGATFTVILPLAASQMPDAISDANDAAEYPPVQVLLVDDNATNRKVVELMLAQIGAEVLSCENGQEAVMAFNQRPFDLVLMDLQMPVMDGLSATRAIREIERVGGKARTPLIVLSANQSAQDRLMTREAGADAHIGKPIRADELITTMMTTLQTSEDVASHAA